MKRILLAAALVALAAPSPAQASWRGPVVATWYGPGFYGNRTACGQILHTWTRGVAHRELRCGTKVTIRRWGRTVRVRVIDRGPYSAATFDLTGQTARDLCGCRRPFTMLVRWRLGWA